MQLEIPCSAHTSAGGKRCWRLVHSQAGRMEALRAADAPSLPHGEQHLLSLGDTRSIGV